MRGKKGFTIVELLITLAVIGILTAIAIPSYQSHVRKGARGAAQAFLVQVADRQAQYLLDARNYAVSTDAFTKLNVSAPAEVSTKYTVTITAADGSNTPSTPPSFTVTATPIVGGPQAADGALTLTHTGAKTRAGTAGW